MISTSSARITPRAIWVRGRFVRMARFNPPGWRATSAITNSAKTQYRIITISTGG